MHGEVRLHVQNVRLGSPTPPLSACLESCLLQIARALGEVLQSAMRTSQTESETGGISSSTPINWVDGKMQLASPAIFHSTEAKKKKIEAFQSLVDTLQLVKPVRVSYLQNTHEAAENITI